MRLVQLVHETDEHVPGTDIYRYTATGGTLKQVSRYAGTGNLQI